MRIFLTGATGFIGGHVATKLVRRGHSIRCLARPTSRTAGLELLHATIVRGDLGDRDALRSGMQGCDWVIHLAATYDFWVPDRRAYREVNVEGTRNVMECALDAAVAKVVHVSTAGVWSQRSPRPIDEQVPCGSERTCAYFESKYAGELIAWELARSSGLPLVVVYPGAVLGPDDPKPTGEYIRRLARHRLPATVFDDKPFPFVHVEDVAEAIVRAAEKPGNIGGRYIVTKHNPTFRELNSLISDESGTPLPRVHMPDWLAVVTARLLTGVANVTKVPPLLGMALDQIRTMKEGFVFDGSRAERELGLTYTPLSSCVRDAVASLRGLP